MSEPSRSRLPGILLNVFCLGFIGVVLCALLFPTISDGENPSTSIARNEIFQIIAAMKHFHTEYGTYPPVGRNGLIDTQAEQAHLIRILQGQDPMSNPRKIVFFECGFAHKKGFFDRKLVSGLSPDGVMLDPWGNPFRVAFDADYDGSVISPYEDQRGKPIPTGVIAWSLGKDGIQSPWLRNDAHGADDVVSWE